MCAITRNAFYTAIACTLMAACSVDGSKSESWNKCGKDESKFLTATFNYADFGPPSMFAELLGSEYWQWEDYGGGDPKANFDVKIVVYSDFEKKLAMSKYVVSPVTLEDYRYVSYGQAVDYLNLKILELEEMARAEDDIRFPELSADLKNLKSRIETDICQK